MSVEAVKTYARTRMTALGYREWTDGFNYANIPQTKLNTSFTVELGDVSVLSVNNDNQEWLAPLTVRAFIAPTGNPKTLIDRGAAKIDEITTDFLKASNATLQEEIKGVRFVSARPLPIADSNDNGVIVELRFNVLVIVPTI